jgi:hypothetical protein
MFLEALAMIGRKPIKVRTIIKKEVSLPSPIIQYEITNVAIANAIPRP